MARYTGPVCRLCRRERTKLYLKGERCFTLKCPVAENSDRQTRAFPPGMHGRDRQRQGSEYLTQLREKQKARRIYGILEKQFRNLYEEASRRPGMTEMCIRDRCRAHQELVQQHHRLDHRPGGQRAFVGLLGSSRL